MRFDAIFSGLALSACLVLTSATDVLACAGQTGKVIFNDDFKDDSGGWDIDKAEAFVPGGLQITASADSTGTGSLNSTFSATEGDYCAVFAFPTAPPPADTPEVVALIILASDYRNRYELDVTTDGEASVAAGKNGNWQHPMPLTKIDSVKTGPGAENTLRVVIKDQKMTFYVNDKQIKVVRAQIADNTNKFGFYAGTYGGKKPSETRVLTVKSFNVTEPQ